VGDFIEIMKPNGKDESVKVLGIRDEKGVPMESCPHPKQRIEVKFQSTPEPMDLLRVSCE
jgi:putative protease